MDKVRILKTDEEMKVFSDPFRLKIISAYKQAKAPKTAKGIADIMQVVPSKVHYHVKKLLAVGILELDHIESINGIQAKFYKLTAEEYRLEVTDSMGDPAVVANRTVQVFNAAIDEVKSTMHQTMGKFLNDESLNKGKGTFLTSQEIYLDDDEAEAFNEALQALIEGYKVRQNDDQIAYKTLACAVQIVEKDA